MPRLSFLLEAQEFKDCNVVSLGGYTKIVPIISTAGFVLAF